MRKFCWVIMFLVCVGICVELQDASAQNSKKVYPEKKKMARKERAKSRRKILNVNTARLEVLTTLPDMTPELAERVLEGRPYTGMEDLLKVDGIDEALLKSWGESIEAEKLNLNDGTFRELTMLPGVTPELAKAIIEHRPFEMPEELLLLDNVEEETVDLLADWIEAKPAEKVGGTRGWKNKKRSFPNRAHKKTPEGEDKPLDSTE
ncbi:MAG: helix-hairpin-helix domain-containing protein [bacterium]|nr:helix-hairpin-helix domain-containing protein [bacterium]